MTDSIAQIEEHLKKLKERDGIAAIIIEDYNYDSWDGTSCTVKVWDHKHTGVANAKNFNLAYTKALKRLRKKNDDNGKS